MCSLLGRHHPAQHRYQSDADESEPEDSTRKGHPRGTQDPHDRYAA